ncbi:expressed unknown protein [Seminavis robusta]|uniref:CPAF-like PDZ domain-containing protein n=1 Tax=Seminavis robusta TaxID=568900 RepID=A0A9N8EQ84_9STRA|nr:expressed unknown protein [Seminavis robusta]|eukprot:Sro1650_g288680.1 n/a (933) ;mRNA; r:6127-9014
MRCTHHHVLSAMLVALPFMATTLALRGSLAQSHTTTGTGSRSLLQSDNNYSVKQTPEASCQATFDNGGLAALINEPFLYISPSFLEKCMETLPLDVNNTIDHIYNLDGIFSQFHCFYNLAKDPKNSTPMSYQPELGYTIYEGEGQGQVDIAKRMSDLILDIQTNKAANITTFWTMNAIFQDLRDGHVSVPPVSGEAFVTWFLRVFPTRNLNGTILSKPEFSLKENGEMALKIIWMDTATETETESVVATINGTTVADFVKTLANSRSVQFNWQNLGARVNSLVKSASNAGFQHYLFPLMFNTRPTEALSDTFEVTYTDGTEETFRTGVFSPGMASLMGVNEENSDVYELKNRSLVENVINSPGQAYQYYSQARGQIVDSINRAIDPASDAVEISKKSSMDGAPTLKSVKSGTSLVKAKSVADNDKNSIDFDHTWYNNRTEIVDGAPQTIQEHMAGYKIEKDYAILKIGTWLMDPMVFRAEVWSNLTAAAKENGITKLMIDISGNGGGYGVNAASLAVSMFPNVEYSWFVNNLDQTLNEPMQDYVTVVMPLINQFENMTESWSDEQVSKVINDLSEDQLTSLATTAKSLENFCELNNDAFCVGQYCEFSCRQLEQLAREVQNFLKYPTPPAFMDVWNSVFTVARELSAWTTTLAGTIRQYYGLDSTPEPVVRGGVAYNVTQRSSLLTYNDYNEAALKALQAQHSFDEYIIVSDGNAASASSIFASSVEQIWKNREQSGATSSVVTVGYGGTGDQSDMAIASIPAAVENIRLDNAFYTTFSLSMIPMLLPVVSDDTFVDLVGVIDSLDRRTYRPSYFAQTLPRLSVQNYYDNFMDPGALPLQYIKMQPDKYIPQFLTQTSFGRNRDLLSLYRTTYQFFSNGIGILDGGDTPIVAVEKKVVTKSAKEDPHHKGSRQLKKALRLQNPTQIRREARV